MRPSFPLITEADFERTLTTRSLLHEAVDHWAALRPDDIALINATRDSTLSWRTLRDASMQLAAQLAALGFKKGDFLAASLPFLNEHVILEYACFRLGVIHAPLDLRLGPAELLRSINAIHARGYAFLGKTPVADFRELAQAVKANCASVEHLIQFSAPADCLNGAMSIASLLTATPRTLPEVAIDSNEGAQVIFTSGSTGSPKPALLTHRGILCQNLCLGTAFEFGPAQRVLLNLPASHVGGQAEILLTGLYHGGTTVMLEIFDAALSLKAIEKYNVTLIGQIPAMFQMEWRSTDYSTTSFASMRAAVYGGQAVPRPFLERMRTMAPAIGTGLGLTECSGFVTYTPLTGDVDALNGTLGIAMPAYPFSIRAAMRADGTAGDELSAGETGHVCFRGAQNFAGYVNNDDATAQVLSRDGYLYTGDMGHADERGLVLSGRAKWVVKTAGYQVFPGDVETHFSALADQVAQVGVVGQPHEIWSEALVAFVEKRPGAELTEAELKRHARTLSGYMRPLHYVILDAGAMPLNRSVKVDTLKLQELAAAEVAKLRERGRWDGADAALTESND